MQILIFFDIRKMRTLNLFSRFIILFSVCFFFLISCDTKDKKLRSALELAGDNKEELLKVIDHYQKEPADSLKLRAARFLVENMPGHFSYDTTYLYRYRPVIDKIGILRRAGLTKKIIREQVNPVMDSLCRIYPLSDIYSNTENDISSVKSDLLINTIEQAFKYKRR